MRTPPPRTSAGEILERGRAAYTRLLGAPLLLADLDGDGRPEAMLAKDVEGDRPLVLCTLEDDGTCTAPANRRS